MPRTSLESGDLAPQTQSGAGTLEKNGFGAGDLPRSSQSPAGRRRPSALRNLLLPIVAAAVCGTGAFVVSNYYMTRWYSSTETIWFPSVGGQGNASLLNSLIGGGAADSTGSVPILGGLYNSPQFGAGTSTAITALDSGRAKSRVLQSLNLPARWHLPPDQAAARFNKNVTYGLDKNGLLSIQANDTDPRLARQIVNSYVAAMRDVSTEMSTALAHKNLVALRQKYAAAQDQLIRQEQELVALQKRTAQKMPLGSAVSAAYADLAGQQTITRTDLNATNAEIAAQLQTARKTYGSSLSLPESQTPSQSTIQDLRKAETEFDRIRAIYGPGYPGYREAEERVKQARAQAKAELGRQYSAATQLISPETAGLYVKKQSLQARLDTLNQAAAARKAEVLSLPEAQMRAADLTRQITLDNAVDTTLAQAVTQAELAEKRDVPNFEIMDAAGVPSKSTLPRVGYTTALATVAGFLLALAGMTTRALLRQPASQVNLRRWTDSYGLTDREDASEALNGEALAARLEQAAPRLSHRENAAVAELPSGNAHSEAEENAGHRQS